VNADAHLKQHSPCNAVRHGLTAETVIGGLEDAEDYKAFEAAIIADYDAQSAIERELVLRLANLLWRLHRATTIETGLFEIEANHLTEVSRGSQFQSASREVVYALFRRSDAVDADRDPAVDGIANATERVKSVEPEAGGWRSMNIVGRYVQEASAAQNGIAQLLQRAR
jgi:hypothetical protein